MAGVAALRTPWRLRVVAGVLLTIAALATLLGHWSWPPAERLDRWLVDARLRSAQPAPDDRIVIIDIDERSLAEVGRWPWSRATLAELLDRLNERGRPSAIGFDVVFAEPERDAHDEADRLFGAAVGRAPVVLGYYFSSDRGGRRSGMLPPPVFAARALGETPVRLTSWNGYGANVAPIARAAPGGFFNPVVDSDGLVRALPLLAEHDGRIYESLAVALLRRHLRDASLALDGERLRLRGRDGEVTIPVSAGLTALVPFGGKGGPAAGRFRYVSAVDVLRGEAPWDLLAGRIVVVGTSAPGLTDLRATPVSEVFPGVEIHASLIAGALDGRIQQRLPDAAHLAAVPVALVGLALSFAMPALGAIGVTVLAVLAASTLLAGAGIAWANLGQVVPIAAGLLLVLALGVLNLATGYLFEGRARRSIAERFGEYVSPALVERMSHDPQRYRVMHGENRELTIVFADIRGFTRIAETMQPEALREYLNEFLTAMTEVIHRYNGTVDKYIGDAVMAFWGAPVEDALHADHAVAAALAIQDEVQRLNVRFAERGLPPVSVGVGVNTGTVAVGDLGSKVRRAYTVIGDAVNLASRLEGVTKEFNVPVVVGEATVRRAQGHSFQPLGQIRVAGRQEGVLVYVPSALAHTILRSVPPAAEPAAPAAKVFLAVASPRPERRSASDENSRTRV